MGRKLTWICPDCGGAHRPPACGLSSRPVPRNTEPCRSCANLRAELARAEGERDEAMRLYTHADMRLSEALRREDALLAEIARLTAPVPPKRDRAQYMRDYRRRGK